MSEPVRITPRTLKGFRDYLPEAANVRERLIDTARRVYRSYGFSPIDTPALEYLEILTGKGGEESDKQIYKFLDSGERWVGLRFDLTVPLARFVAQHASELTFPFKRYHIATVWRGENTQRGRYTAFGQRLDIDRGRLLFNGAVDNPGLDILAMRKNQAVAAGVAVTGNVNSPVVRIVSDPPVPEGEALSWLVLGRGPADASRADLAMLPLAAAALFGGAKPGEDSFASKLGLDTLSLRGSTTLANNVVAVGKRFSHNLYVAYEQSLGGVANVLKVELNLTRRFLLRAETGEVSAAGLFFRYAFD